MIVGETFMEISVELIYRFVLCYIRIFQCVVLVALESSRTISTVIILWCIGQSLCASHDVYAPYIIVELFICC